MPNRVSSRGAARSGPLCRTLAVVVAAALAVTFVEGSADAAAKTAVIGAVSWPVAANVHVQSAARTASE